MKLLKLQEEYQNGQIEKYDFIKKMHSIHSILNQYPDFLKSNEIKNISINEDGVVMTTDEGIKMKSYFDDNTAQPFVSLNFGLYEKSEISIISKFIKNGDVFFDIGANHGWYSLNFAKKYPDLKIYAFEPIAKVYNHFNENIKINSIGNINAFNMGFWFEDTVLKFNFYEDFSAASSVNNILDRNDVTLLECNVQKLDTFVKTNSITQIDFIKCDVEGAEFFVLQGGKEAFIEFRPILFVEMLRKWSAKFNYHPNNCIEYMKELGYGCFEIEDERLVPVLEITNDTVNTNFFFIPFEKIN